MMETEGSEADEAQGPAKDINPRSSKNCWSLQTNSQIVNIVYYCSCLNLLLLLRFVLKLERQGLERLPVIITFSEHDYLLFVSKIEHRYWKDRRNVQGVNLLKFINQWMSHFTHEARDWLSYSRPWQEKCTIKPSGYRTKALRTEY